MNGMLVTFNSLLHLTANMVHMACDCEALSIWRPVICSNFRTTAETVHYYMICFTERGNGV